MPGIDRDYVNSLNEDELRRELIDFADNWIELMHAIRDEVEMPSPWLLKELGSWSATKYPEDNSKGCELQMIFDDLPADDPRRENGQIREPRYNIPFKSECEGGAGLWWRIRQGLLGTGQDETDNADSRRSGYKQA